MASTKPRKMRGGTEKPHMMDYMFDSLPSEEEGRQLIEQLQRYKADRDKRARGEHREYAGALAHPAMLLPTAIGLFATHRFNQVLDQHGDAVIEEIIAADKEDADGNRPSGGAVAKLWEILARP